MDAENKKHLRVDVDMSRLRECVQTHFEALTAELGNVALDMVRQMNLEPKHEPIVCNIILAQAMLIYADGGAAVAEQAKKVLVGVTKVEGRMH